MSSGMGGQGCYNVTAHATAHNGYQKRRGICIMRLQSIGWKVLSPFWDSLNIDNWDAQLCWPDFDSTMTPCSQYWLHHNGLEHGRVLKKTRVTASVGSYAMVLEEHSSKTYM